MSVVLAAALLAACESNSSGERKAFAAAVPDTGRVTVDGGSLFYEAAGAGDAIVFIHGGNLDHRMWDAQFVLLQRTHRVIRYDARGFGISSAVDRSFRAPDDLAALLRAHGIAKATLVGLSMGGGIAIDFALAYPDMVHRLVLASPSITGRCLSTMPVILCDARANSQSNGKSLLPLRTVSRNCVLPFSFWWEARTLR